MNKWHKWIAYGAIVVFVTLFMTGIGLLVIKPFNDRARAYIKQSTEKAHQYNAKADSLESVVIERVDSVLQDKVLDSVHHVQEKKALLREFKLKEKTYAAKILAIDTIPDDSVNRVGSVRKMLCDSSVRMW